MTKLKSLLLGAAITGTSFTTNANTDMVVELSRCAQTALASQHMEAKKISVKTPSKDSRAMDHDLSRFVTEYRMSLKSEVSGKQLGKVACRISQDGEVTSTLFVEA